MLYLIKFSVFYDKMKLSYGVVQSAISLQYRRVWREWPVDVEFLSHPVLVYLPDVCFSSQQWKELL